MVNDASEYRSACTTGLLESLVERTGNDPVLLVLDGIGAAFDHESNFRFRRERFLDFCESILNSWLMSCDNFYFLLIGGGDIFEFLQDGRSVQRGRYDIIPFAGGPTMNKNTPRLY